MNEKNEVLCPNCQFPLLNLGEDQNGKLVICCTSCGTYYHIAVTVALTTINSDRIVLNWDETGIPAYMRGLEV